MFGTWKLVIYPSQSTQIVSLDPGADPDRGAHRGAVLDEVIAA